eukprot:COSAG01_NODE_13378_length_1594_cov_0.985953_1_plen_339_part_00
MFVTPHTSVLRVPRVTMLRKVMIGLPLMLQAALPADANCAAGLNQTGCVVSDVARACVAGGQRACKAATVGGSVTTVAGSGTAGAANGIGTAAQFNRPRGVAISGDGTFALVADDHNHRIRHIVLATQAVTTLAGSGTNGFANGIGTAAQFNFPTGVAISGDGTFALVADLSNHRIRHIVLATQAVTTLAGSGTAGAANGIGTAAQFNDPLGVAISADGTFALVVGFHNHRIRRIGLAIGPGNRPGYVVNATSGLVTRCPVGTTLPARSPTLTCTQNCIPPPNCQVGNSSDLCVGAQLDTLPRCLTCNAGYYVNDTATGACVRFLSGWYSNKAPGGVW